MCDAELKFRDFGITLENLPPPPQKVRSFVSSGAIVRRSIGVAILVAAGIGLAVTFAATLPKPVNVLGCAAVGVAFTAFVSLLMVNSYRWVELEGDVLRVRCLYTGHVIERHIDEIESVQTLYFYHPNPVVRWIIDRLLGRVLGVQIRFRDQRSPLDITCRAPRMANARELIEAILYRMAQKGELEVKILDVHGRPLVHKIHWKYEQPSDTSCQATAMAMVIGFILLGVVLGTLLGYWSLQEYERWRWASIPPQEMTLADLIEKGPGLNRHVAITDFRPGGYAVTRGRFGEWTGVYVALYPAGVKAREIKAVLTSRNVSNEHELLQLVQRKRISRDMFANAAVGMGSSHRSAASQSWATLLLTQPAYCRDRELPSARS